MPRKLIDDWRAGQLFTWTVTRGKCSYGDNHESVRLVGGQWKGETWDSFDCDHAPRDVCPICKGEGSREVSAAEAELLTYDGTEAVQDGRKPCEECEASGWVPGPHWPWRHPHPGPVQRGKR